MHSWRTLRLLGWTFLLGGLAAVLFAQDRASDLLKGRPAAEPTGEDASTAEADDAATEPAAEATERVKRDARDRKVLVVSVPISETIDGPNVYILKRAIKSAIEAGADVVVFRIDTPGGYGSSMLEMMEAIQRFEGTTIAFVDDEAMSAGAFISFSADEIWYVPNAVIGSAAVVAGSGQEIPETMRKKIDSYIRAKIRAVENHHPFKAKVMRAMMDADYVLRIDGKTLKPAGELLALTAHEALEKYGKPPTPLFGEGIADDVDSLLDQHYGKGNWELTELKVTWSEEAAKYLNTVAPLLVALGILAIFIEIKTPGFGVFGAIGIVLILLVFSTNYLTGLAGMEPAIAFIIGIALIALEILVIPGTFVVGTIGLVLVLGSLVWSMADLWPTVDGGVDVDLETLLGALARLSLSVVLTTIGIAVLWKFLPETSAFKKVTLQTTVGGRSESLAHGGADAQGKLPDLGARGRALIPLRPLGRIMIDGEIYEAKADQGVIATGEDVVVIGYKQFHLLVEKASS